MTGSRDLDQQVHDNLRELCRDLPAPAAADDTLQQRCLAAFDNEQQRNNVWRFPHMLKKRSVWTAIGMAAAIVIATLVVVPGDDGPTVQAAVIMQKLNQQVATPSRMTIVLDHLSLHGTTANGTIQTQANGLVGDLQFSAPHGDQGLAEGDFTLALSDNSGWVLVRSLSIPDPQAQAMLSYFLPPGQETLVTLPPNGSNGIDAHLQAHHEMAASHSQVLFTILQALIDQPTAYGATIDALDDGMVLLTLPITNDEVIAAIDELAESALAQTSAQPAPADQPIGDDTANQPAAGQPRGEPTTGHGHELVISFSAGAGEGAAADRHFFHADINSAVGNSDGESDSGDGDHAAAGGHAHDDLLGSTMKIVYDPQTESVKSVVLEDLGDSDGVLSITFGGDDIDPGLFDAARVTNENTHRLDLAALAAMFGGQEADGADAPANSPGS